MLARSRYCIVMIFAIITTFNATYVLAVDAAQAQRDVEQWRAARVGRLTSPTGWLTLVGLYWFNEGANSFGRAEKNTLVLDHKTMPNTLGTFTLSKGKVIFTADPGSTVTQAGKPVKSIAMRPDTSDEPTVLDAGPIEFFVIERVGKMGLRVRDTEHPARKNFHGIDYFPINSAWAVDAKFEPYTPVHYIEIINIQVQLSLKKMEKNIGSTQFSRHLMKKNCSSCLPIPRAHARPTAQEDLSTFHCQLTAAPSWTSTKPITRLVHSMTLRRARYHRRKTACNCAWMRARRNM
jgi:uncharacterized protein (DUF1684 family)